MPSKTSRPLGFAPSTSGNLVPSLATDSALTYAQFPTSSFFEIGPLCCDQAPEAPNNINTAKAAVIDLFMVSPSLYPLSHPRHEALHPARHAREVAAFHYLHHFLHLLELVEQAIDFLHRYARARGDAALARGLEDFRPILRIWPICRLKSSRSKPPPFFSFSANFFASSTSTVFLASSTSESTSPMPRMREAMRSE